MSEKLVQYLTDMQTRPELEAIYEVVKTVDVSDSRHRLYRIEVYRDYSRPTEIPLYEVRYYIWWDGRLAPMEGRPALASTWISYDGPSTSGRASVEDAVSGALSSLLLHRIHQSSPPGAETPPKGQE